MYAIIDQASSGSSRWREYFHSWNIKIGFIVTFSPSLECNGQIFFPIVGSRPDAVANCVEKCVTTKCCESN
jgi:hypothetical protein